MAKRKLKKGKKSWWRTFLNITGYALVITALIIVFFIQMNQGKNQLFSIFGYSVAVIQSGSMTKGNFFVGDRVLIRSCNTDDLRKDDIIVFYMYADTCDRGIHLTEITSTADSYEEPYLTEEPDIFNQRIPVETVQNFSDIKLVFHRITAIFVDDYGIRFFETKGDSNDSVDRDKWGSPLRLREDYVAGQHIAISDTAKNILNFVSSPIGLFIIILIPIAFLVILQIKFFASEMVGVLLAKKLVKRKIRYDDKDLKGVNVSGFLSENEKIYIYDVMPKSDKDGIIKLIWGDLDDKDMNIQQKIVASNLKKSFILYADNREKYWDYWIQKQKKIYTKKQLQVLKIQADLVLKEGVKDEDAQKKALEIFNFKEFNSDGTGNKDIK